MLPHSLPLYRLTTDDGVPVVGQDFRLEITRNRIDSFTCRTVTTVSDYGVDNGEYLILGMCYADPMLFTDELLSIQRSNIYHMGVLVRITERLGEIEHNLFAIEVEILERVVLGELSLNNETLEVDWASLEDDEENEDDQAVENCMSLIRILRREKIFFNTHTALNQPHMSNWETLNTTANIVLNDSESRLRWLQECNNSKRIDQLIHYLLPEIHKYESNKPPPPPPQIAKRQTIQQTTDLVAYLKTLSLPQNVLAHIQSDMNRYPKLDPKTQEHAALHEYLYWVGSLPWGQFSSHQVDLHALRRELDRTHYGLQDTKQLLVEHMTIQRLTGKSNGSIMCFVGNPGTGKTTLAKSIATATGRQTVRIALGGISDEAELRGHRRTYVQSRPGRIMAGIRSVGQLDPVIILDEVDKTFQNFKGGDITAGLLELLDPEQNNEFLDRYLEFGVDLSRCLFICTANDINGIPGPLRDRVEIVEFRDYTQDERLHILRDYLLPKNLAAYCLTNHDIDIPDMVLDSISKTVQVRDMERQLQKLLRVAAVEIEVDGLLSTVLGHPPVKPVPRSLGFA